MLHDAALADENRLTALRTEQSQIITFIMNMEGSLKQKINRWAEIVEERVNLADPELSTIFTISQISTYIADVCRINGLKIADDVHHYLPDKYKNANKQNFLSEDSRMQSRSGWGGIDPKLLIEEYIALPTEYKLRLPIYLKSQLHDTITDDRKALQDDSHKNKYQLDGYNTRDPIETTKMPERITELGDAFRHLGKTFTNFGDWIDENFAPPEDLEEKEKYADGIVTYATIYENAMNEKYSLTDPEWLERDTYRIHQSKHGAAVKDKVETTLCEDCTKLDREKYVSTDFVEMEWDWSSPTHWRCKECQGTRGIKRGLTREQCGDIAIQTCPHCHQSLTWEQGLSPIENRAIELANNLPYWYDVLRYLRELRHKKVGTRKVKLGVDLSLKA